jgi:hypothetical protein
MKSRSALAAIVLVMLAAAPWGACASSRSVTQDWCDTQRELLSSGLPELLSTLVEPSGTSSPSRTPSGQSDRVLDLLDRAVDSAPAEVARSYEAAVAGERQAWADVLEQTQGVCGIDPRSLGVPDSWFEPTVSQQAVIRVWSGREGDERFLLSNRDGSCFNVTGSGLPDYCTTSLEGSRFGEWIFETTPLGVLLMVESPSAWSRQLPVTNDGSDIWRLSENTYLWVPPAEGTASMEATAGGASLRCEHAPPSWDCTASP